MLHRSPLKDSFARRPGAKSIVCSTFLSKAIRAIGASQAYAPADGNRFEATLHFPEFAALAVPMLQLIKKNRGFFAEQRGIRILCLYGLTGDGNNESSL